MFIDHIKHMIYKLPLREFFGKLTPKGVIHREVRLDQTYGKTRVLWGVSQGTLLVWMFLDVKVS